MAPAESQITLTVDKLRTMLDRAYYAGRTVREEEFAQDLQRRKGLIGGAKRFQKARVWEIRAADWAAQLIIDWNHQVPLSISALAVRMVDDWDKRTFSEGPNDRGGDLVDRLRTELIPQWIKEGLLSVARSAS